MDLFAVRPHTVTYNGFKVLLQKKRDNTFILNITRLQVDMVCFYDRDSLGDTLRNSIAIPLG
jgi:hypothetical protein